MPRVFFIKDLKDLENGTTRAAIDIKVLKDLKRPLLTMDNAGDRPPRYGTDLKRHRLTMALAGDRPPRYGCGGRLPFIVGRGPVPRHA